MNFEVTNDDIHDACKMEDLPIVNFQSINCTMNGFYKECVQDCHPVMYQCDCHIRKKSNINLKDSI